MLGSGKRESARIALGRIDQFYRHRKRSVAETLKVTSSPQKRVKATSEKEDVARNFGVFGAFSPEQRWGLYSLTGPEELARLCLSSRGLAVDILEWLKSAEGRRQLHGGLLRFPRGQILPCSCCNSLLAEREPSQLSQHRPRLSLYFPTCGARQARGWGLLLKAATSTLPTGARLRLIQSLLADSLARTDVALSNRGFLRLSWGIAIHSLARNWAFRWECDQLFRSIFRVFANLQKSKGKAATAQLSLIFPIPNKQDVENCQWELRLFLRCLFLDPLMCRPTPSSLETEPLRVEPSKEGAYWLSQVLLRYPHRSGGDELPMGWQGKMLFLLYAPILHSPSPASPATAARKATSASAMGSVTFDNRRLASVPVRSFADAVKELGSLAWALESLARYGPTLFDAESESERNFSIQDVFGLVEEVTTYPEPWALDNFAALLLLAPVTGASSLALRIIHNSSHEAATIANTAKTLAFRWNLRESYQTILESLLRRLPNQNIRAAFLLHMHQAATDRLREIAATPGPPQSRQMDLDEELNAQLLFQPHVGQLMRLYLI